jgi:hypothetical protein
VHIRKTNLTASGESGRAGESPDRQERPRATEQTGTGRCPECGTENHAGRFDNDGAGLWRVRRVQGRFPSPARSDVTAARDRIRRRESGAIRQTAARADPSSGPTYHSRSGARVPNHPKTGRRRESASHPASRSMANRHATAPENRPTKHFQRRVNGAVEMNFEVFPWMNVTSHKALYS